MYSKVCCSKSSQVKRAANKFSVFIKLLSAQSKLHNNSVLIMETLAEIDTDTSQVCLEAYSEFCQKLILGLIFRYWGMSKTKKVTKALLSTAGTK